MRKLIQREVELLKTAGYGQGLGAGKKKCPPAVLEHIDYLSSAIINAIKLEVKDRLVSLMIDIGTRNRRDILGVSVQYMRDGQMIIRNLGMILLTESHTALNINNKIRACLKIFDIKPCQVVSITSDNASNMVAMVKSFNRQLEENIDDSNNDSGDNDDEDMNDIFSGAEKEDINRVIDEYHTMNSMNDDEMETERRNAEASEILEDTSHYLELLKDLQNDFALHTLLACGIRCAAHTLQLAMKGALKSTKIKILLNVCRMACKLLRKQSYKNKLKDENIQIPLPSLDCAVRWNSTFKMVKLNFCIRLLFGSCIYTKYDFLISNFISLFFLFVSD